MILFVVKYTHKFTICWKITFVYNYNYTAKSVSLFQFVLQKLSIFSKTMETCKMKSFVVAIIVIVSLVSAFGAAVVVEDATSIAPTPSMQSWLLLLLL